MAFIFSKKIANVIVAILRNYPYVLFRYPDSQLKANHVYIRIGAIINVCFIILLWFFDLP